MLRHVSTVRVRNLLSALVFIITCIMIGCSSDTKSTNPTDEIADNPATRMDSLIANCCEPERISTERLVIDFHEEVSRSAVDSLAARHGLIVVDPLMFANSYLFSIDRAVVNPSIKAQFLADALEMQYPQVIQLAEAEMPTWVICGHYHSEGIMSPDRLVIRFEETPSSAYVDSFALEHGLIVYPEEEWPFYVHGFMDEIGHADRSAVFFLDRSAIPLEVNADCLGVVFGHECEGIETTIAISRFYRYWYEKETRTVE